MRLRSFQPPLLQIGQNIVGSWAINLTVQIMPRFSWTTGEVTLDYIFSTFFTNITVLKKGKWALKKKEKTYRESGVVVVTFMICLQRPKQGMLRCIISAITEIKSAYKSYDFPPVTASISIYYQGLLVVCIDGSNFLID